MFLTQTKFGSSELPDKRWMGGVMDEKGGAGVRFDIPFDDRSSIDLRAIKSVVIKALENMYHTKKWESLVHVGLRFNAVTE